MADIVLINPRFEISFWGLEHVLPIMGKRANMPVGSLPLLAALTPAPHQVTLIDENVEAIDFERVARADIVGLTGQIVQRFRMREILAELKDRGACTIVGGSWVSVQEDYFEGLADVIFVGEADESWPRFLREWEQGRHQGRYQQAQQTDMSTVPTPRFDLLKMQHYLFGSVQFSRGCPFKCEFCDIPINFGHRPRLKTSAQMMAELDALRAQNTDIVFIVDDNLIGNKKAIKVLLRDLIDYQRDHGYFFHFFTDTSLDLAEDAELMDLMAQANIVAVFIGIESPNEDSLRETKKFQNVRAGGSMLEKVWRIQEAGMEVMSGMILGFDHDNAGIFEAQLEFMTRARIVDTSVGMLYAIPKTPLHARLAAEGRLDPQDDSEFGTNAIPLKMSREELRDGYIKVISDLYEPKAFFGRLEDLVLHGHLDYGRAVRRYWRGHPRAWFKTQAKNLVRSLVLYQRLMWGIPEGSLRREYRRRLGRLLQFSRNPSLFLMYVIKCGLHYHQYTRASQMAAGVSRPLIGA
ncbi:MAG: DUF4070 domain-containing protein [Nitrospirae bacterium]|nr:MAG: DUF4070 domain-containing protein [Nitrospirota bacterium]